MISFMSIILLQNIHPNLPLVENMDDGLWHDSSYFSGDDGNWHDAAYFTEDDGLWHDDSYF